MEEQAITHARGYARRLPHARQKRGPHARPWRLQRARDHLQREQVRAQHYVRALEQALVALGLPETLAVEVEGRVKALGKLLGNIVGVMLPPVFACRTAYELTWVRSWDKHLPGKILGALPKPKWGRPLPHRGRIS